MNGFIQFTTDCVKPYWHHKIHFIHRNYQANFLVKKSQNPHPPSHTIHQNSEPNNMALWKNAISQVYNVCSAVFDKFCRNDGRITIFGLKNWSKYFIYYICSKFTENVFPVTVCIKPIYRFFSGVFHRRSHDWWRHLQNKDPLLHHWSGNVFFYRSFGRFLTKYLVILEILIAVICAGALLKFGNTFS